MVLSLCRPKILSCLLKLWSHFPTHIHPLTLSMLLFIFPCLSLSYSPSSFPLSLHLSIAALSLIYAEVRVTPLSLSQVLALSISVPLAFFCRPCAGRLEAFNEIYGEIAPHQTLTCASLLSICLSLNHSSPPFLSTAVHQRSKIISVERSCYHLFFCHIISLTSPCCSSSSPPPKTSLSIISVPLFTFGAHLLISIQPLHCCRET